MSYFVEVTQADIDRYARVSGDHNPLHVDQEYAATTRFGSTIAHGMMTMSLLLDAVESQVGSENWSSGGEIDVRFKAPVFPGDRVEVIHHQGATPLSLALRAQVDDRVCVAADAVHGRGR